MTTSSTADGLTPLQARLLARLQQAGPAHETTATLPPPPPLRRRTASGAPAELSFAQRRLWFVQQMQPDAAAYSAPMVNRVRGPLDAGAMAAALRRIIERHEPLRTTFTEIDGEPRQVVGPVPEHVLDLESVEDAADPEAAAMTRLRELVAVPFDLESGPMLRATLVRLAAEDHYLLLNIHHITSDAWSMGVLVSELDAQYTAATAGGVADLPELPVSYADYAVWQRELLSGPRLQRELDHWGEKLRGAAPFDLPGDRPRPALPGHRGATTSRLLPPALLSAVRQVGADAGASPFITLLAGFAGLLAQYTGEHDLTLGTSVAGRESDEIAGLIGFFVNTLVLRTDVSGDPDFRELVRRTRLTTLEAHEHQALPFDLLVEHVSPARDLSRPPLVSVLFQQDNTPDCAVRLSGLDVELADFDPGTTKFDLLLSVRVWESGVRVHAQYNTELFDPATIDDLLAAYETFVTAATSEPDRPLSHLPLLTPDAAAAMLTGQNRTARPLPDQARLHDGFEHRAAVTPAEPAAVVGGRTYTFGDLDARANRIAHELQGLGVGPDVRVALCLPRGIDLLTATLAVLKAGGAFVPVDPDYPAARVEHMLTDSGARVVLTRSGVLPVPADLPVLALDDAAARIESRPATPPPCAADPENLCYVIYTSGSTGVPKGIALRHRGVLNNLLDLNERFDVGPGDRVLALSSPSFDMSVYELLGVPNAGGAVVLPDPARRRDPAHWLELITEHGVTVWNSAPALLTLLLDAVEAGGPAPAGLRVALLGGDWIPVSLPDRLRAAAPSVRVISLGGATEASIHSTVFEIGAVDPGWTSIPYGRPMANQLAVVLDDHLRPVPVGVRGNLYLGGVGLARGYLGAAEAANARFVQADLPGLGRQRLYLTGDLARWRRTGELELIGRIDAQVKLNGLRIELGEIEAALRSPSTVAAAAATVQRDAAGDQVLIGYVVPEPGATVDPGEVRTAAADRLPSSMVPSRILVLEALPLSPNGKVDRRALPIPQPAGDGTGAGGQAPQGAAEERIAGIWAEQLGLPVVGRDDDFFALGGDSFKAVRVVRAIDPGLPVIELFRNPTVRTLAAARGQAGDDTGNGAPALLHRLRRAPAADRRISLVCLPYGGGQAIAYQPLADALPDGFDLWSVDLPGHDLADARPPMALPEVIPAVADEVLRCVDGPVALYGQCAGAAATIALARELERRGKPVDTTFVAAALPDRDPRASARMVVDGSDDQLLGHLRRLGGFEGALLEDDVTAIIGLVRHDLGEAVRYFLRELEGANPGGRLSGPVHVLVGGDDPATVDAADRYRDWGRYAASVTLTSIPAAGHYFNKHQPVEVARIVGARTGFPSEEEIRP
jgi:amino acid adenylation domain-containing protein